MRWNVNLQNVTYSRYKSSFTFYVWGKNPFLDSIFSTAINVLLYYWKLPVTRLNICTSEPCLPDFFSPPDVRLQDCVSLRSCFCFYSTIMSSCCTTQLQFKASVAKPWTKLRLGVYTCNYHPGTALTGSWHPKHCLPGAFLITLIILLILFMALLLITSREQASGKQTHWHTRFEQIFENKI